MAGKAIGVDLGGTFIKAGVVDDKGKVLSRVKMPTGAAKGRNEVISRIAAAADGAREKAGLSWRNVRAVGLGSPGTFEPPHGIVHHCTNLKFLEGKELARPVAKALGKPELTVTLDNDANVAAYAESWVGAGRGLQTLVLFTLGTGIGGGIVLNGEVWRGAWAAGAELGHQILFPDGVLCECGNRGCLEAYASATGLMRRFKEAVAAGRRTRLAAQLKAGKEVTPRDMTLAAKAGDRTCRELIEETGRYLGAAVTNMLHILNVECVIFTGGMTAAGSLLLKPIREEARRRTYPLAMRGVKILFSRMGNDAGLIGAAGMVLHAAASASRRGSRIAKR